MQIEVIHGLAVIKKASAIVNKEFGLDEELADAIVKAADEVMLLMFICSQLECVLWGYCQTLHFVARVSIPIEGRGPKAEHDTFSVSKLNIGCVIYLV